MLANIALFFSSLGAANIVLLYFGLFVLFVISVPVMKWRNIPCNFLTTKNMWLLLYFGLTYTLFDQITVSNLLYYVLLPILAYTAGWAITESGKAEKMKDHMLALIMGFGAHVALNFFNNIGMQRSQMIDFWSNSHRNATALGMLNTFLIVTLLYTLCMEKRKRVKCILLAMIIVAVLYMFMLGTRTQYLILVLVGILSAVFYFYETSGIKGVFKCLRFVVLAVAILLLIYTLNLFDIQTFILKSNLIRRFTDGSNLSASDAVRFKSIWIGLKELLLYPLGGRENEFYRHNMWLDVGRVSGIIPFALILSYSISTFLNMWKIFCNESQEIGLRYLVFGLYVGIMLNFLVEPIMEGFFDFFLITCVLNGMVDCFVKLMKSREGYSCERDSEKVL